MPLKSYRTAAFHGTDTKDPGCQPTIWYWTFEPLGDSGNGLIRAQKIAVSYKMDSLIAPALPAAQGIEKLIELENTARNDPNLTLAHEENYETRQKLGHQYHSATPYQNHPAYVTKQHQTRLKAHARSTRPLQLKPRVKGPSPK